MIYRPDKVYSNPTHPPNFFLFFCVNVIEKKLNPKPLSKRHLVFLFHLQYLVNRFYNRYEFFLPPSVPRSTGSLLTEGHVFSPFPELSP